MNNIKITGIVNNNPEFSHEYKGRGFYRFIIETESSCRGYKNIKSNIRCYIPDNLVDKINKSDEKRFTIDGYLVNSTHDGHRDVSVIVSDINQDMDSNLGNFVELEGSVSRIFTNNTNYNKFVNFVISLSDDTEDHKRYLSIRSIVWYRLSSYVYNNIKVGDKVHVAGSLCNSKLDKDIEDIVEDKPSTVTLSELHCTSCYLL